MASSALEGSFRSLPSMEYQNLLIKKDRMLDRQAMAIANLQSEVKEKDQRLCSLLGAILPKPHGARGGSEMPTHAGQAQPSEEQKSDEQEAGYSSDTSIELDDNCQLLESLRRNNRRPHNQVAQVTESLQNLGLGESQRLAGSSPASVQAQSDQEENAPRPLILGPDLIKRLLDENLRLKGKVKAVYQDWTKDNENGRNTIEHLRRDVARLKYENMKLKSHETELSASLHMKEKLKTAMQENEKLKEELENEKTEKIVLKEQMLLFKSDFETERSQRKEALKTLEKLAPQVQRYKEQNEALRAENTSLRQRLSGYRSPQSVYQSPQSVYESPQSVYQSPQPHPLYGVTPQHAQQGISGCQVPRMQAGVGLPIHPFHHNHLPQLVATDSGETAKSESNSQPESTNSSCSKLPTEYSEKQAECRTPPAGKESEQSAIFGSFVCKRCQNEFTSEDELTTHMSKCLDL